MRIHRNLLLMGACSLLLGISAWAQTGKPGLWEVTSTMTWQQSPMPAGMSAPGGGPHTVQVCVTQEQIDKYGTAPPQTHGDCHVTNVVKKAHGMTAEMVCSGPMEGKGSIDSSWTDSTHTTTKVHFLGHMEMGPTTKPIEWTVEADAAYKGPDCGKVKPYKDK